MLCNYARANTNTNALIALPSNLLIPRTVSTMGHDLFFWNKSQFNTMAVNGDNRFVNRSQIDPLPCGTMLDCVPLCLNEMVIENTF